MRQVKSSLEVAGNQKFKTTNSLFKPTNEVEHLESVGLDNNQTAQILAREKARAAKFESSVDCSQKKLLKSREKIAGLVNRNRALTNLRHQIQKDRDHKKATLSLSALPSKNEKLTRGSLRGMELKY